MKAVYTITPSWLIQKKKDFLEGVKTLEKLGFKILNRRFLTELHSASGKIKQIHAAFRNRKVEIILAQRGGFSSMKLLPRLDFHLIRNHPKVLAGFSDVSTLLNAVHERTGLITLHSPMVINFSKPSKFTVRSFLNATGGFPEKDLLAGAPVTVYRPGTARGVLKGGNLATLTALIGTEWEIDTKGAVLFLEDVDEKPHAVDRNLTQWLLAGKFRRLKGLILGDFRGIRNREVWAFLSGQMKIDFPLVHCPYIGHGKNKITLPVGARVKLNAAERSLTIQ